MSAANPLYFFSYSRQELYFAESAVVALQKAGVNVWFDLQQLEPGSVWADEIQRGLTDCDGMIVLASRASFNSPWVALEWLDALEKNKPVYVILFEAVTFDPIPASEKTNNAPIPLDKLKNEAVAILDLRRNFQQNITRLAEIIKKEERVFDVLPTPNRWRIPTVMPLGVAFVAFALVVLTGTMLWISVVGFSIYWPMMLGGLAITAWLGDRTLAFLRRRSFREPRALLVVTLIASPFISLWLTPIFALGAVLVNFSPDVERWSPLGQGTDRHRSRMSLPRRGLIQRPTLSGKTYHVVAAPEDKRIVDQIHHEMQRAGHENSDQLSAVSIVNPSPPTPLPQGARGANDESNSPSLFAERVGGEADSADFTILVLSNYTPDDMLQHYAESSEKIICVAASALDDWARFKPLARFQFVDYRRQQRPRLTAMALDILNIGSDKISTSFSTHQTPQAFEKSILPGRAASAIGFLYIGMYLVVGATIQNLLAGEMARSAMVINLVVNALVTLWLMIRATRREISVTQLFVISVALPVFNLLVSVLLEPALAGLDMRIALGGILVVNTAFYLFVYAVLLRSWLPARQPRLKLSFRRDLDQWRFHALVVLVSGLFAVTFLGNRFVYATTPPSDVTRIVSAENQITLDVPAYWYPAESPDSTNALRRTHDFILGLERVSSPLGQQGLNLLSAILFGSTEALAVTPIDLIEVFSQQIDLGTVLLHDARYVPDAAQGAHSLRFGLWAYPRTFLYADEASVLSGVMAAYTASDNPAQAPLTQTALGDVTRYEQRYFYESPNPIDSTGSPILFEFRFVVFDTPGTEYWLMFSGDSETMENEAAAIDRVIDSARFDVIPTPSVVITLDNLRFEVPAIWQTVTIPDVNDPATWEGADVSDTVDQFIKDAQAFYDAFDVTSETIWGAQVVSLGQGVAIALSRFEDASTLVDMLITIANTSLETEGVELVDDQTVTLGEDDSALRIIQLEISGRGRSWLVALIVENHPYLIQIVGDVNTMNGYADALNAWLRSFDTVE